MSTDLFRTAAEIARGLTPPVIPEPTLARRKAREIIDANPGTTLVEIVALAERYADECSCCDGTGTVWTNPNDPQEAIDLPCPDCADIRAVIDRAT